MPMTRRDWLRVSAGALTAAAWPVRAAQTRPLKMLLDTGFTGANAFLALADDKGYLAEAGATLTFTPGAGAYTAPQRMLDEGFDFGFGDLHALIELVSREPERAPVAVYTVYNTTPATLAVKADGPIELPYDLSGRRVIGHASDVALQTFGIFAGLSRIAAEEVTIDTTEASTADMLRDLMSGKCDGVFADHTTLRAAATAEKLDIDKALRVFEYDALMTDSYGSAVLVNRQLAASSPDLVRRVLRAFTRGLRDAILQPDAAIEAVARRALGLDRAIERARLQGTLDGDMSHPEGQRIGIGDADPGRLATSIVYMVELRKLERVPGILEVFRDDYLPPINERITSLGG